jgi:hypothetical protein
MKAQVQPEVRNLEATNRRANWKVLMKKLGRSRTASFVHGTPNVDSKR